VKSSNKPPAPGASDSKKAAGLQKQMESLQKQLGNHRQSRAMDSSRKIWRNCRKLPRPCPTRTAPAAPMREQKMAESLSALAQQAQQMGLNLPQLG